MVLLVETALSQQAVAERLLTKHSFRRHALEQNAILQVTLQARQNLDREEKELVMNLPSAYEQWKAETLEAGECRAIEGLLIARFGPLDEALSQIVPDLVVLHPVERARLILDLSRAEIIEQFKRKLSR